MCTIAEIEIFTQLLHKRKNYCQEKQKKKFYQCTNYSCGQKTNSWHFIKTTDDNCVIHNKLNKKMYIKLEQFIINIWLGIH